MAQVVVSSGLVGRFGATCTPFACLRRRAQNRHGGIFPVYPWVLPEKTGMVFFFWPARENRWLGHPSVK